MVGGVTIKLRFTRVSLVSVKPVSTFDVAQTKRTKCYTRITFYLINNQMLTKGHKVSSVGQGRPEDIWYSRSSTVGPRTQGTSLRQCLPEDIRYPRSGSVGLRT